MKRLTLFLKGNVDLRDSLHSCRIADKLVWNGINDALRTSHPGCLARVKHETWTRSDALLQSTGAVPEQLKARNLPLGPYPVASQFSRAVFEKPADAIILSVQADAGTHLVRHRRDGFLFYPSETEQWRGEDRDWLKSEFESAPLLDVAESMGNFATIIEKIRERNEAPILIYNMSPVTPGEMIHCHQGFDDVYSSRIRRFNLGLIELSEKTGISIIDVDSLLARKGTDALKVDTLHLKPEAYELIAAEVVRVLDDLGVLADN